MAMRTRVWLTLAGTALAVTYALARSAGPASGLRVAAGATSQAAEAGSDVSRIALVAVAVVAVAAFTVLQIAARSRCGRDRERPSWPS